MCGRFTRSILIAFFVLSQPLAGQEKLLTVDEIYDPEKQVDFSGSLPTVRWLKDGKHYLVVKTDRKSSLSEWTKVETASGRTVPFYDLARMEAALAKIPGLGPDQAKRLARQSSYELNPAEDAFLMSVENDLYLYETDSDRLLRLTSDRREEREAGFSPDGRLVSFVRDHNLYVLDLETRRERALTSDGGPERLNGILDWVYQEEIYGRGKFRGYWWSPDSGRIAYLQLDETQVPRFTVVDHIPYRLALEVTHYPKAGDPNPIPRLAVVGASGIGPRWLDLQKYQSADLLIVRVGWAPDSKKVVYQVQNREQTWLDLNLADPSEGSSTTLLRETFRAWVEVHGDPYWLKDGSFLWLSERSGWKHLYHYKPDGSLIRPVTSGQWDVRELHGADDNLRLAYLSGTERGPLGSDAYRVGLDGSGLTRLTEMPGTHQARFSPDFTHFVDTWSEVTTPPQMRLFKAQGSPVRPIELNPVKALADYRLSKPEFLHVETRVGFLMEAFMLKPPDFDPARQYPVWVAIYGGPHAPLVRNQWGGPTHMWYQMLAQKGFIIWICDNRTASGKGAESTWPVYRNFGEIELRDIEDGVNWLKKQTYVDAARIGIGGWSFGGFMTSYALTHSKSFKIGIAGAPVTDWRDYDTIYTERYMGTPQNNPEGYRESSPVFAAKDLHGKLLLIHGTMDDNVHLQNTVQFAYELQKAGKAFELMLYPKSRHAVTDPLLVKHMRGLMTEFILRNLAPGRPGETSR